MKTVLFVCALVVSGASFAVENQNQRVTVNQANTQSANSSDSTTDKNTVDSEVSLMNPCRFIYWCS